VIESLGAIKNGQTVPLVLSHTVSFAGVGRGVAANATTLHLEKSIGCLYEFVKT